uniref:Protein YIPF n=1 Tax=Albugo laibachii Nc14 TaxID=890382 RepID=F0WHS2_9STRA|nr:conserved hypothetical protein [Albugo laibachii Nc14]|eukprot:CCA20797.1 conserved hypothetical protein [Albugo laibachii Nc14]
MNSNLTNNGPWFTPSEPSYGSNYTMDTSQSQGRIPPSNYAAPLVHDAAEESDYDNEPPLLEELGIHFEQIWVKTQSVLLPMKQINEHILDDADLAGPLVYCFVFGMCLLLSAKVHFGYIYGFGVISCLSMYLLMNLLSPQRTIDIYRVCSVLGYCLLPIIALAALNIVLSIKDLGFVGFAVASVCAMWSTHTASRFFEKALFMSEQKYLVAYPIMLVYSCFVLITVF